MWPLTAERTWAGGFSLKKICTGSVVVSREMLVKAYSIGGSELISWKVCDGLFKCNEMWRDIGRGIFSYLKLGGMISNRMATL